MTDTPRLYADLAEWWPLLSPPSDYAGEAAGFLRILQNAAEGPARTCLELGAGGGSNAVYMKRGFELTLVDLSDEMLEQSRRINPECEHLVGDMRDVRLGRSFDSVFIHDAISYMTTRSDLLATVRTAHEHLRPGGAALFCPDHIEEWFEPGTSKGGSEAEDGRAAHFLEWIWDPDPEDERYTADFAYLLRDVDGSTRVEHDRHVFGLFSRQTWLAVLTEAGFSPRAVTFEDVETDLGRYEVFLGIRSPE